MISGGYYNQDGIVECRTVINDFLSEANVELKINDWMKTGLLLAPTLENLDVMSGMESYFSNLISITFQ